MIRNKNVADLTEPDMNNILVADIFKTKTTIPFFDQFKMSDFCSITVKRSDKNVGFFLLDFLEKTSDFKFSVW